MIPEEEVGEEEFGTSRFYDVHSKLEGPCVADLAGVWNPGVWQSSKDGFHNARSVATRQSSRS